MKDIQARLKTLATQLRDLEQELGLRAKDNHGELDDLDEAALRDFKDAIDGVRHMIWPYVEAAAARTNDVDSTLQRYRMQRVTDMLQNLKSRVETPDLEDAPEVRSFFSNIQQIATAAVEKHLERLTQPSSKRPTLDAFVLPKRLVN